MKKLIFAFVALVTALVFTPIAKANSFDFTYTGSDGGGGSGTLDGADLDSGEWLIVDASGTFNDGANSGSISMIQNPNAPDASLSPLSSSLTTICSFRTQVSARFSMSMGCSSALPAWNSTSGRPAAVPAATAGKKTTRIPAPEPSPSPKGPNLPSLSLDLCRC